MIPERRVPLRVAEGTERLQVVVKFNTNTKAREALRTAFNFEEPRDRTFAKILQPIERALSSRGLKSIEPLFPEVTLERAMVGRSFSMSLPSEAEDEFASFNVLTYASPEDASKEAAKLNNDKLVEFAHVIQPRYLFARRAGPKPRRRVSSVDPLLNRQWGITAVKLPQAQTVPGFDAAAHVKIGVIDSGIDANHPDLRGILAEEVSFTRGGLKDTQGHGTHVTGIIAAVSNNQVGISGVCQSRSIHSLKALGPYDGPGYYRAIRHAIAQGLQVLNFSLGGDHDPTEEVLIKQAIRAGIVVVAAMGNDKLTGNPISYPAKIDNVIAVGATNEVDERADFSQTGSHIHLVAPGVNILSTVPTYPSTLATTKDYEAWPGTSMATPFVTATVALMLAKDPGATIAQIRQALAKGTDRVGGQRGRNSDYGHGRLNIEKALAAI